MRFLVFSRGTAAAAVAEDDHALNERHWTYMDGYAGRMTARGPTLAADRQSWTGSLHVVDLPDAEAAREFVAREPYHRAGLFEEHLIWRFADGLGRTMWQFARAANEPCFLVLAPPAAAAPQDLGPPPPADLPPELRRRLVLYGELRRVDGDDRAGIALAVQAPTREALGALLGGIRLGLTGGEDVEIHDWEFGGRR